MTLPAAADLLVPERPVPSPAGTLGRAVPRRDRMLGNGPRLATLDSDAPGPFEESTQFVRRVAGP